MRLATAKSREQKHHRHDDIAIVGLIAFMGMSPGPHRRRTLYLV
jgi:hypothetical protein